MNLFGLTRIASLDGNYACVLVDDYSRYTWVYFLAHKNDAFKTFEKFAKRVQKEKFFCISSIRSDNGTEFKNELFKIFCNENGISHTFSSPRTPQKNEVVERKNRTLVEMAKIMFHKYNLSLYLWTKIVNTICYILN